MNFFPDIIIVMPLLCLLLLLSSGVWVTQAHLAPAVNMNITCQYKKPSEIRILSNNSTVDHFNSIITVSLSE